MRLRSLATDRVKKSMFSKFSDFSYSNYITLKTKCKILFSRCSSIYSISTSGSDKLKATIEVDNRATTALLDTCAEVTLISSSFAQSLNLTISPTSNSIISFDGTKSKPLGKTIFRITQGSKELICENALVVHNISSGNSTSIIRLALFTKLQLLP